jgi:hypothetical protein
MLKILMSARRCAELQGQARLEDGGADMVKRRRTKRSLSPKDYMKPFFKGAWQGMYTYWNNPAMWSDQVVHKTLRDVGGKPYTVRDVRSIIKSYCKIMKQYVKQTQKW